MDLAELKFVVDTKQLENAAAKVAELGAEVSKLNKPMQDLSNNTNKVSTATEKAAKATETKAKADTKVVDTSSKLDGLLAKLTNRYTDMSDGSTSAEASVLQLARSLGATTEKALEPYRAILEDIRGLSKSPFDSAIGSVRSITQEYDSLTYRAELASKGIFLTTAQLKEYSRIANEIKGKLKAADLDPTKDEGLAKFNSELKVQQDLYLGIANKVNTLKTAEKDRNDLLNTQMKESVRLQEASDNLFKYNLIRHKQDQDGYKQDMLEMRKYYSALEKESKPTAQSAPARMDAAVDAYHQNQARVTNEAAKANAYLAKEMERVNRLNAESDSVTSSTNNRLIRFEQELRKSGASAEEQSHKLALYRKELLATQKAAGNRQVDYLSRALGPQITDIGVGLATGQSPMMVLLQQGGQLRDQFALAGVAGKDMGDMLVKSAGSMITSIKDVGLAVGQVFVKSIMGVGTAVVDGIISPFKRLSEARNALKQLDEGLISNLRYTRLMEVASGRMYQSLFSFAKVGAVLAVAGLAMFSKGLFDVIKEQDALTTQLVLTGASLGVNTTAAISYANSLNSVGVTTANALKVMQSMAKEGGFVAGEINMIATSADNMKLAGVAIEDVVKQFAKLKEKPVEALLELAKTTGLVAPEVTKLVYELVQQGKTSEAAAVSMKAYADVTVQQKDRLKTELSDFALFMKGLSSNVGEFFDEVFRGLWRKTSPTEAIKREIADLENTIKLGTGASDATKAKNNATLTALKEQLQLTQKAADLDQTRISDQARNAKLYQSFVADQSQFASNEMKRNKELAEAERNYQGLVKTGQISQVQYEQLIANIKEKYKDTKKDESLDYYQGVLLSIEKLTNNNTVAQSELNKAQLKMLELIADPRFVSLNQLKQAEALQRLANASAIIDEVAALEILRKQNLKVNEEYIKEQSRKDKAFFDEMQRSDEATRAVKQESEDLVFQASIIGLSDRERTKAIASRKIELDLIKEKRDIENNKDLSPEQKLEQLAEATARATERTKNLEKALNDAIGKERMDAYGQAFQNVFTGMGDALVEFAKTGKLNFSDLINSMIADLVRFEMRQMMLSAYQGIGGTAGIMSTIATAFTGTPVPSAKGNMFDSGGIQAFANGGAFTNSIVSEPTLFKFAKGTGLMGEAGPEAIMPLRRGSDGSLGVAASGSSGSNVSVQVINNSSSQATTNETVDSKGNRKIEVVIGDMQAGEISRSGSASQKSIKSTFGLQPQLIRR